jgi:hypothetical protein
MAHWHTAPQEFPIGPCRRWTVPGWGYGDGILNASGSETALYSSVKDLNRDLHAIGNTLIDANCVAVYHQSALDQLGIDDEILGQYRQTYNIVTSVETRARDGSGHDTGTIPMRAWSPTSRTRPPVTTICWS